MLWLLFSLTVLSVLFCKEVPVADVAKLLHRYWQPMLFYYDNCGRTSQATNNEYNYVIYTIQSHDYA